MSLFFFSVKDFDTGLLETYTVKVLHIMHASSLGSAKCSSLWIWNYLWKQCFVVVVFSHVVLYFEIRIPSFREYLLWKYELFSHNYEIRCLIFFFIQWMQCASVIFPLRGSVKSCLFSHTCLSLSPPVCVSGARPSSDRLPGGWGAFESCSVSAWRHSRQAGVHVPPQTALFVWRWHHCGRPACGLWGHAGQPLWLVYTLISCGVQSLVAGSECAQCVSAADGRG